MVIVETHQLSKTYKSGLLKKSAINALVDVSLEVKSGEIFGLLGPNGAGKTTFVKILLSIVLPTSGTAILMGKRIGTKESRNRCGYLPENHRYPSYLTALETLSFFGQLDGLNKSTLQDRANSLLAFVGLSEWKNQKVRKFSKGMLQRLGLAQALLHEPEILFLDEPTDGVDPLGRKEMRELFLALKQKGVTLFLNSHLLSEVELISDRVAILNKGSLVKVGTLDEVRGSSTMYEIQISGLLTPVQREALAFSSITASPDQSTTTLVVDSDLDLNRTIDLLRSRGILIQSVAKQKSTLEDSFVKLVSNGGPQ